MTRMTVRPMTREDLPVLAELERLCFAHPWSEQGLAAELAKDNAVFLVACDEAGLPCGYVGMNHVLDEGYIDNLAVHPYLRRQGIGLLLLETLLERCRALSLCFLTLEARQSNAPAIALYSRCGFVPVGMRRGFYRHPDEDAVLMTHYLK